MAVAYKISTKDPAGDRMAIRRSLSHMHTACGGAGAFLIGNDTSSMGWTFFEVSIDDALEDAITAKFADMISKYKGKDHEKLYAFMVDYANSKGCSAEISRID